MQQDNAQKISLTVREAAIESELGNIAKGTFIANLDHCLRAPVNSMMGMLNLLEETDLNDQQRGYVNSALDASAFLMETINQITEFPVNSYDLELDKTHFDLFKAGKNVIKAFSGLAARREISLCFECEAETPTLLDGDPVKLQQVLAKLIENAVNFTQKGSVSLFMKSVGCNNGIVEVEFKVIDTGVGISEEKLEHLFDFTHDLFSGNPKSRRVSLELAVCREIVKKMGGSIAVTSEKNKGTEVCFTIPFTETSPDVIDEISKEQVVLMERGTNALRTYNGLKVLLAEDDLINQSLAVAFLTKLGASVDTADNGVEAVESFKEGRYDIIFMDCEMPELDGFDATREIRKIENCEHRDSSVPIIAMTAYAARGDRDNCLASGMNDHVPKPITVNVLQEVAEKYIFSVAREQYKD
jgi:CheY-like chemotaxis protein/nitrogen-specific signal transduction histidine kinase